MFSSSPEEKPEDQNLEGAGADHHFQQYHGKAYRRSTHQKHSSAHPTFFGLLSVFLCPDCSLFFVKIIHSTSLFPQQFAYFLEVAHTLSSLLLESLRNMAVQGALFPDAWRELPEAALLPVASCFLHQRGSL